MSIEIRKAERRRVKLRIGVFGPSGAGKTMSALKIAHGIAPWEKICVVDTENGSAELYSHLGGYSVITLTPPYEPEKYVEAIKAAGAAGFEVIIIDSITHEWQGTGGVLEIADAMSASMRDGRQVWTKLTPRHNRFIDALLQSPAHTINCGRSKQEIVMTEKESNGRTIKIPEKMGLKAITRDGFDYEMTVSFDLAINHFATCTKDRTKGDNGLALFQDKPARILDEEIGKMLKKWSEEGKIDINQLKRDVVAELIRLDLAPPIEPADKLSFITEACRKLTGSELNDENLETIVQALRLHGDPGKAKELMFGKPAETPKTDPGTGGEPPKGGSATGAAPSQPAPQGEAKVEAGIGADDVKKVFGDGEEKKDQDLRPSWRERVDACKTEQDALDLIAELIRLKEKPLQIGLVHGMLLARGLLKQ